MTRRRCSSPEPPLAGPDLIVVRNEPMPAGTAGPATGFAEQTTQALVAVLRLDPAGKQVSRTELGQAR